MKQITFFLDEIQVTVPEGNSILEAARQAGNDIPTLCQVAEKYEAHGELL